tara:strand:+ start:1881 stop:2039 length:159 start_codon:yes stop_codon:yes gene_type:complete
MSLTTTVDVDPIIESATTASKSVYYRKNKEEICWQNDVRQNDKSARVNHFAT